MKYTIQAGIIAVTIALPALALAAVNPLATLTVQAGPNPHHKTQQVCAKKQLTAPQYIYLVAGGPPGSFSVTNSSTVPAINIRADLAAVGFNDVTQNATNCAFLMPGNTCSIILTPGPTTYGSLTTPIALPVQGDNTTVTFIAAAVVVLAVGDLWEGGMIFRIDNPLEGAVVALEDVSAAPVTWNFLNTTCNNYSVVENCVVYDDWELSSTFDLPDIYNNVYLPGYLINFQPGEYWGSETGEASLDAETFDFSTGLPGPDELKTALNFGRCTRTYAY